MISFQVKVGAQTPQKTGNEKIQVLNNYVNFINESIHGLLIVDKLLETYNLDINKYVDLESYKINQYTNKDLPLDIFEDPEHWFYEVSPYDWYSRAKKESLKLATGNFVTLQTNSDKLLIIIKSINQLRFDLDKVTIGVDLTNRDNLNKVYQLLEKGVTLYQDFYRTQKEMEKLINSIAANQKPPITNVAFSNIYEPMSALYKSSKVLVTKLRDKDTDEMDKLIKDQIVALEKIKLVDLTKETSEKIKSQDFKFRWNNMLKGAQELNDVMSKFQNQGDLPEQYKLYGKYYYYYNVNAISKFNRYGSAFVFEANRIIELLGINAVKFTETPHYYQVIYPKKIEALDVVKSSDGFISSMPKTLKERTIQMKNKIRADNDIFEIFLYDNMIEDGDVVSINFNGDFILENFSVVREPRRVALKLNSEGKNYIVLHAVNVGKRPPATVAFSYKYNGEKKEYILKSDLNSSELIEILLTK